MLKPGLGVILVGENIESKTYVNMKIRACKQLGIYSKVYELPNKIGGRYYYSKNKRFK